MESKIKVLFIAGELNPIAKVGGLADVIGALPKSLARLNIDVRIVIPKYGIVDEKKYKIKKVAENIKVPFYDKLENFNLLETILPDTTIPVYLIDHLKYLGENGVYFEKDASSGGSNRECQRFTFFARSTLEIFNQLNWWPDIIHCHDWHVGIVPVLIKIRAKTKTEYKNINTLLTIHNLAYQGRYNANEVFKMLNLKQSDYPTLKEIYDENLIYLQQAILNADHLNTVSPTYAQEILTPEYGETLESSLQKRGGALAGILNGIDIDRFNPENDQEIIANYSYKDLSGKVRCKEDLQETCGLKIDKKIPILGIVSRLTEQKGIDLIRGIADELMKKNLQFILLGTGGEIHEKLAQEIVKIHPEKSYAKIAFDAHLAQQIYAGSDIFLMPSRFEPCGLGQMISMRYGTIPVVRATGGLKDTVQDYNPETEEGDGFVFENYDRDEFLAAVKRALALYQTPEKWYKVVRRIMQKDFSWENSAKKYLELYKKILNK